MLSVTQAFFAGRCLLRMLLAVSVTAVLKLLIKASVSVSWFSRARSGTNFPPIVLLEIFLHCWGPWVSPDWTWSLCCSGLSSFGGGVWRSSLQAHGHFQYRLQVSLRRHTGMVAPKDGYRPTELTETCLILFAFLVFVHTLVKESRLEITVPVGWALNTIN